MSTTKIIERTESEVQGAARKKGLTFGELAAKMGVTKGYLSQIANGHRKWTPKMRAKVMAVLGEVPGQSMVRMQQEAVDGESTYIRERARELGLTMRDVAARAGLSHNYVSQVSRGHRIMTVNVRKRLEAALEGSVEAAPAERADVNIQALWDRMNAHDIS
ncbi:MAG: helix-turn-helix transcriptional regulator, partial [Chloroflexi bacterium]|nr:helix-turn-helix transcriptional regulator [Chloroflexota bacterium]